MGKHGRKGIGGHTRPIAGATDVWLTPPEILNALGPFDLDPCAPEVRPWDTAARHYWIDGLSLPWSGRIWLNPPYSDYAPWVTRLADHGSGIAILFARTETVAFDKFVWQRADALLFIRGRLHFHRPDGVRAKGNAGGPGPSVLVAYGNANADALKRSGIGGAFIRNWNRIGGAA